MKKKDEKVVSTRNEMTIVWIVGGVFILILAVVGTIALFSSFGSP